MARNVRTGEVKYFLSDHVVSRDGVTLRRLLRVAFGRWAIQAYFRSTMEGLGLDHYEVRGWQCVHRHWFVTQLSHLFCSRLRQTGDGIDEIDSLAKLTVEQVRAVVNS